MNDQAFDSRYLKALSLMCSPSNAEDHQNVCARQLQIENPLDSNKLFELAVWHGLTSVIKENSQIFCLTENHSFYTALRNYNKHKKIATSFLDSQATILIKALIDAHVTFVALKGFALARTVYEASHIRTKADVDILIAEADHSVVKKIFTEHEYFNPRGWVPRVISKQYTQRKHTSSDFYVDFDVHLLISSDKRLENILSIEQILKSSITDFETGAQLIGFAHALLHAVFHLMSHRSEGDTVKLIWFYDIFLLCNKMDEKDKKLFLKLVDETGLSKVTISALTLCREYFDSKFIQQLIAKLDPSKAAVEFESLLLVNNKVTLFTERLCNQSSLKQKVLFFIETVLPPKEELYAKYGRDNKQPIILLYVRRIIGGIVKYLKD